MQRLCFLPGNGSGAFETECDRHSIIIDMSLTKAQTWLDATVKTGTIGVLLLVFIYLLASSTGFSIGAEPLHEKAFIRFGPSQLKAFILRRLTTLSLAVIVAVLAAWLKFAAVAK